MYDKSQFYDNSFLDLNLMRKNYEKVNIKLVIFLLSSSYIESKYQHTYSKNTKEAIYKDK